jgi:uncharacterized protein
MAAPRRPHDGFMPGQAPIDAYSNGGFRFGDMSHRGSILVLPSGIHAWDVDSVGAFAESAFERVFAEATAIETLLIGTGATITPISEALRWRFRDLRIGVDVMQTGAAARTYNILLAERRAVAAALLAVD